MEYLLTGKAVWICLIVKEIMSMNVIATAAILLVHGTVLNCSPLFQYLAFLVFNEVANIYFDSVLQFLST
jgi:hypothetical protein